MTDFRELLNDLAEFERTPEAPGYDLRMDLAEILLRHLDGKQWTQRKLAEKAGMKAPAITRIIHGAANCTFETAGRVMFALKTRAKLVEIDATTGELVLPGAYSASQLPQTDKNKHEGATDVRIRQNLISTSAVVGPTWGTIATAGIAPAGGSGDRILVRESA